MAKLLAPLDTKGGGEEQFQEPRKRVSCLEKSHGLHWMVMDSLRSIRGISALSSSTSLSLDSL